MLKIDPANIATHGALQLIAALFSHVPEFRRHLSSDDGWLNFTVRICTEAGNVDQFITFQNGKARASFSAPGKTDIELVCKDVSVLKSMVTLPPNEVLNLVLKNRLVVRGNLAYAQIFNFFVSLLAKSRQIQMMKKQAGEYASAPSSACEKHAPRQEKLNKAVSKDMGVHYLANDPYLSEFSLHDFPRLERYLDIHFTARPAICHERPFLLTKWFRENGFEEQKDGTPWSPELRQGSAFKYLMENKEPFIRKGDLIAGTTTTKEIGVVLYPDSHGTMICGGTFHHTLPAALPL